MNEQLIQIAICVLTLIACIAYILVFIWRPEWLYRLGDVPPPLTEDELNAECFKDYAP